MYLPTSTHILPLVNIRCERLLPHAGYVITHEGARVDADDVVAKTEAGGRHYIFDLARRLQVSPAQADKYVRAKPGMALEQGDTLAVRRTLLGLSRLSVRSPAKGTVIEVGNGRLLYEAAGSVFELRAGLSGVVVDVIPEHGVTIEATGAVVQGVWGSGRQDFGLIKVVETDAHAPIPVEALDSSARGAIVVGHQADVALLRKAELNKVRGLILGSMPAALLSMMRMLSFPVLITEGFGRRPMSELAWGLLAGNNGREAFVDARPTDRWNGRRPEVIIPLPSASSAMPVPASGQPLKNGQRVRVLRAPFLGAVGKVKYMPPRAQYLPSGVLALVAQVEQGDHTTITAPLANLEILD